MAWELYAKLSQWDVARYIMTKYRIWEVYRKIHREWEGERKKKALKGTQLSVLGVSVRLRGQGKGNLWQVTEQVSWQLSSYSMKTSCLPHFTRAHGKGTDIRNSRAFHRRSNGREGDCITKETGRECVGLAGIVYESSKHKVTAVSGASHHWATLITLCSGERRKWNILLKSFYYILFMCACARKCCSTMMWSGSSPSTKWVLGIELRSLV